MILRETSASAQVTSLLLSVVQLGMTCLQRHLVLWPSRTNIDNGCVEGAKDMAVAPRRHHNGVSLGCSPEQPSSLVLGNMARVNESCGTEECEFRETSHEFESRMRALLVIPHLVYCRQAKAVST